jgi:hypothetical protein
MRGCKPDPLAADIVHMREDRGNCTYLPRRLGSPGGRVKMFDEHLVDTVVYEKNLGGRVLVGYSAALSVKERLAIDGSTRCHGLWFST